jgi:hypothetical protein
MKKKAKAAPPASSNKPSPRKRGERFVPGVGTSSVALVADPG